MSEQLHDHPPLVQDVEEEMVGRGSKTHVAFLGPKGSYSHQVILADFPEDRGYVYSFCRTIKDVFIEIQECSAVYGLVPFENSTEGAVSITLELLANRESRYDNVSVVGEAYVGVHHTLLGHKTDQPFDNTPGTATPTAEVPTPNKPHSRPLVDLSHVKTLYTHPMAWGQCEAFLSTFLPGRERVDSSSTSKAAETVATDKTGTSASISCIAAAHAYGLDVLARNISDKLDNTTRFLVLVRDQDPPSHGPTPVFLQPHCAGSSWRAPDPPWKSLIRFMVDHNRPGALVEAMSSFGKSQINITSINTRPSLQMPWHYIFFIEFIGRIQDENVSRAIEELKGKTRGFRFLGSFKDRSG